MKKLYDLAVKTGTYTNSAGEEKGRYLNIGSIMEKDDGGKFILLNRTFNPAGVPNPDNRESLIVSMFAPKKKDAPASAAPPASEENPFEDDGNIPF